MRYGPGQDRRGAERLERLRQRIDVVGARVGDDARAQPEQARRRRRPPPPARCAPLARWEAATRFSRRVSVHLTGRPTVARERGHGQVLGHHVHLLAEAAARVRHDHPHAALREAEGAREDGAVDERDLGAGPDREASSSQRATTPRGSRGAAEHAAVVEALADADRRAREGAVHVALAELAAGASTLPATVS